MRRRPHLPPAERGPVALHLTSAAAGRALRLPVCQACSHVTYPPEEICGACLSGDVNWQAVPAQGELLADTRIHRSLGRYFEIRPPHAIALVRLDAGPVLQAHLADKSLEPGARVAVLAHLDDAGQGVFSAVRPEHEAEGVRGMALANTDIEGRSVAITGAGGGLGQALIAAFRESGAARIFAAARTPQGDDDGAVTWLSLEVTDADSVAAFAAGPAGQADILVNNAGVNGNEGLLSAGGLELAEREMAVNYLGTLRLIRAVAPAMKARNGGLIVNLSTILAHANLPAMGSYCASKAALHSLTQGIRAELMPWGVRVLGVYPGAIDTAMTADFPPPKMAPAQAARAVIAAIRDNLEDCYPGDMAEGLREQLLADPKAVERDLARMLPEPR